MDNMFNLFTGNGDKGETSLLGGEKRKKSDAVIKTIGAIDELDASIGVLYENIRKNMLKNSRNDHTFQFVSIFFGVFGVLNLMNRNLPMGLAMMIPGAIFIRDRAARKKYRARSEEVISQLDEILEHLKHMMSSVSSQGKPKYNFPESHTSLLEKYISAVDISQNSPLKNFIAPTGCKSAALAHMARTICRRAETHLVEIDWMSFEYSNEKKYLNRLSSYLFGLARYINFIEKNKEVIIK